MNGLVDYFEAFAASAINGMRHRLLARVLQEEDGPRGGFVVGKICGEDDGLLRLRPADRARHCYVLGATGSGKTNLLLRMIQADVEAGKTIVVLDLRGDLVDRTLNRLASTELASPVCLIDLRQDEFVTGFNPLSGSGDVHARALHTLDVLRHQADSWGIQLDETLRFTLIALTEAGLGLAAVEPFLTDDGFRFKALDSVRDPAVLSFAARYDELSRERQQTLYLPVLNKVSALVSIPPVRRVLAAEKPVHLQRLLDRPGQVVLVALAVDRLHRAAHLLGGLVISSVQCAVTARTNLPEAKRNPVSLYIDEFENFASDAFESIIAEGRRFGLSLTLSHQNLSQVSPSLRQVLRNNVGLQIYFQTGSLDANELSSEIVGLGSKDDVRSLLMTQAVGAAIVAHRGQVPVPVQTLHAPDQDGDPSLVAAIRQRAFETFSAPATDPTDVKTVGNVPTSSPGPTTLRHDRAPRVTKERRQS